jgi:hypothetical protein
MNSGTSQNDSDALKSRGWTLDSIKQQEAQLRSGCQPVEAVSTCEVGHGIFILTSEARTTAQVALKKSIEDGAVGSALSRLQVPHLECLPACWSHVSLTLKKN